MVKPYHHNKLYCFELLSSLSWFYIHFVRLRFFLLIFREELLKGYLIKVSEKEVLYDFL